MATTQTVNELRELANSVATMVGLGAEVPAPAGTSVYIVLERDFSSDTSLLGPIIGTYASLESAVTALAQHAAKRWDFHQGLYYRREAPWMTTELYEDATRWRYLPTETSEEEAAAARTRASVALCEIMRRQEAWLHNNSKAAAAAVYLGLSVDDSAPLDVDDWAPFISVHQIVA